MKYALSVCVVVLAAVVASTHAQDYYYGAEPAPSMYAAAAGQMAAAPVPPFFSENGQPIPAAPSMDSILAGTQQQQMGAPYFGQQQQMMMPAPSAFVEHPSAGFAPLAPAVTAPYATQEAETAGAEESEEEGEEADTESAESEEEAESSEADESEAEAEGESESAEGDDARFMERRRGGFKRALKRAGRKVGRAAKRVGRAIKKAARKAGRAVKKLIKRSKRGGAKTVKAVIKAAKKRVFKPKMGKSKAMKRAPAAKTPKAAGRALPPMPAPLPKPFKINCKKNPNLCIDAETPAEGEEPGDHSPKAVFKKKMEVIKKSLMINNRNIAAESKWIDQVELIMKQYALKVKKVKEHIADERKAIKELLRQRRIILNEKKQKELQARLKMATTELTSLTDALSQVKKKEQELGSGRGQLDRKIKSLAEDLKKLQTDKKADEAQALKKAD